MTSLKVGRNSSIEFLKIVALFFIVISHVSQSFGQTPIELKSLPYPFLDLNNATHSVQLLTASLLRYLGEIGNAIFLVCSFSFLCMQKDVNKYKVIKVGTMILDVWVVNLVFLLIYLLVGECVSKNMIVRSCLPTLHGNNWFVTCYIIVYLIFPGLNAVIGFMSKKAHLLTCIVTLLVYDGIVFFKGVSLFYSDLIQFVIIYFVVAYMKLYLPSFCYNKKINFALAFFSLCGIIGMLVVTNMLGLHSHEFADKLLKWKVNNNPFILLLGISMFNIVSTRSFVNPVINYVAGLSLLIYLIHENILFRSYTRVRICGYLLEKYGDAYLVMMIISVAFLVLLTSILFATIYKETLHRIVVLMSKQIGKIFGKMGNIFLEKIMKLS